MRPASTFFGLDVLADQDVDLALVCLLAGVEVEPWILFHLRERHELHRILLADGRGDLGEIAAVGSGVHLDRRVTRHVERVEPAERERLAVGAHGRGPLQADEAGFELVGVEANRRVARVEDDAPVVQVTQCVRARSNRERAAFPAGRVANDAGVFRDLLKRHRLPQSIW